MSLIKRWWANNPYIVSKIERDLIRLRRDLDVDLTHAYDTLLMVEETTKIINQSPPASYTELVIALEEIRGETMAALDKVDLHQDRLT